MITRYKKFLLLLILHSSFAVSAPPDVMYHLQMASKNNDKITESIAQSDKNSAVPNLVINAQLDRYFQLKKIDPENAMVLLEQVLKAEPTNATAHAEMGYLLLARHDSRQALQHFKIVHQLKPNDAMIEKQIGYINQELAPKKKIVDSLKLKKIITPASSTAAPTASSATARPSGAATARPVSATEKLFNEYYKAKKTNPSLAKTLLEQLLEKDPENINAHKEMGYLLIKEKNSELALCHFKIVDRLSPNNYEIKMQIAYLLNELGRNREAYGYFSEVAAGTDKKLSLKANQAMTGLAGTQTKILPKPWFADLYFSPFYYSRFRLYVFPLQFRIGRTFGCHDEWEVYASTWVTWDNKSKDGTAQTGPTVAPLPQIFNDNVAIEALGVRYRPFYKAFPNFALYVELGEAYSIVNQQPLQSRWRNDARGGYFFDGRWGAKDEYAECLIFPFKQVGTIYNNVSYYSRYSNLIGYLNVTEGLRVAEYHTASLDIYASVRAAADKNQEFFNNFVEIGPAIKFTPNNRYGFNLRAEFLQGYYINVNSPSPNPYGSHYYNMLGIAEFYIKI